MNKLNYSTDRFERLRRERRLVVVRVDLSLFGDLVRDGIEGVITSNGLPADALFVDAALDPSSYGVQFIYAHESFASIEEGVTVPVRAVTFTRYYKGVDQS